MKEEKEDYVFITDVFKGPTIIRGDSNLIDSCLDSQEESFQNSFIS
jgi:hypothetical protein